MNLLAAAAGLFSAAFVVSVAFCLFARQFSLRIGFVDKPGGRKAHGRPTPLGGGVAFWLAFIVTLGGCALLAYCWRASLADAWRPLIEGAWLRSGQLAILLVLSGIVMLLGLADDRFGLDWRFRLAVQFGAAAAYVFFAEQATFFQSNRWLAAGVTIVWIVGLTNSFNFLDNMDGLAASVGLIASLLFVGAQVAVGSLFVPAVLLVLAGVLAGFLIFNRPPARLFMGDAGSNALGFLLGTLTVAGTFTREGFSPLGVLTPLLVMAVPLYDTFTVVWIRLREGRSPFQADRSHFSHRLVERGLTPARAVVTIDLVTLAAGLGALLLHRVSAPWQAALIVGQTLSVLGVVALLEMGTRRSEGRHAQSKQASQAPPVEFPGGPAPDPLAEPEPAA